jgi:hypothetical protein
VQHNKQQYKPGDIANGHILGTDGQWTPLPPNAPKQKKSVWGRWYMIAAYVVVGLIIVGSMAGGGSDDTEPVSADVEQSAPAKPKPTPATEEPAEQAAPVEEPAEEAAPAPAPKPKPKPKTKAVSVDAGQILAEFEGNEAAADAKYQGKTLKVTGVVDKVDTEFWNNEEYTIQLSNGDEWALWTVNCNDMSGDEAAKVQAGSTVTVVGKFDDGGDLGVELKDCHIA